MADTPAKCPFTEGVLGRSVAANRSITSFRRFIMAKVILKNVRIAFPDLFVAKAIGDGKPAYGCTFLFPREHDATKAITVAIKEAAAARWGEKADAQLKAIKAANKLCLHDGDEKPDYQGYPGNLFLSARNNARPTVIHRNKQPLTEADGVIYSGCRVNASIDIWAQDNQFGKRINASLQIVQLFDDVEQFAGGSRGNVDDFDDLDAGAGGGSSKATDDDDDDLI